MQNPCNKLQGCCGNRGTNRAIILKNMGYFPPGQACPVEHRQKVIYNLNDMTTSLYACDVVLLNRTRSCDPII